MGMFDNFEIDYPLPIEEWIPVQYRTYAYHTFAADGFQTKDLECLLDYYYIDNSGSLFKNKQPSWFKGPSKDDEYEKIYFHGHINVYNSVSIYSEDEKTKGPKLWFEYDLKFTDGLLVCATMLSPTKKDIDELHTDL